MQRIWLRQSVHCVLCGSRNFCCQLLTSLLSVARSDLSFRC